MYLKNKSGIEAKINKSAEILTLTSLSIELYLSALLCKMQSKNKKNLQGNMHSGHGPELFFTETNLV